MAIFSRRTVQRLINENSVFLTSNQTKNHIRKLNLEGKNAKKLSESNSTNKLIEIYLNNEWEVVLLNVLSKLGGVTHEPNLDNSKKEIDVLFTCKENNFEFLADITCITGKQDKDNLLFSFEQEFRKIIDQNNLGGQWNIHPASDNRITAFPKSPPKLKMVGKKQFETEVFNTKEFCAFIERIKKSPEREQHYQQKNELINLSIDYKQSSFHQIRFSQLNDREIVNVNNDEIYQSLNRKHDQLSETGYQGHLGIILCDGIDNTFNRGDISSHKTSRDVINNFLFDHPQVDFVLTVTSTDRPYNPYNREPSIEVGFYEGYSNKLSKKAIKLLKEDLVEKFPKPARDVFDAKRLLKETFENKEIIFSADYCGIAVSENEIKISAKKMLELLAGQISFEDFFQGSDFESLTGYSLPNKFLTMLDEGKLIDKARIEKGKDEIDDDWLVFTFGKSDPAISLYKMD